MFEVPPGFMKVNAIKSQYLVLLSCMFFSKARGLACYVRCHLLFFVNDKVAADCLKMILFPHSNKSIGLNLINMRH